MGARRDARKLAVRLLYAVDIIGVKLDEAWGIVDIDGYPAGALSFARELAEGTLSRLDFIDEIISRHTENWESDRITNVDKAIIRLGLYEINFESSIPRKVSINEAVELAKYFSTAKSHKFVNGILDAGSREDVG